MARIYLMYLFHHNVYYTQPYKYGNFTVTFNTVVAHLGKNPHAEINFALAYSDNSRLKFIASLFTDKARSHAIDGFKGGLYETG